MRFFFLYCFLSLFTPSIFAGQFPSNGLWHGTFELNQTSDLPIQFTVKRKSKDLFIHIHNAEENISFRVTKMTSDSICFASKVFRSEFKLKIDTKKSVTGKWYNYAKGADYFLPFSAQKSKQARFQHKPTANTSIYGKWEVTFNYSSETDFEKAVGVFLPLNKVNRRKAPNGVKGTFLTETGDYRFLEGNISEDSLYLSTFDGSHAFLFRSHLKNDTLWGDFLSGSHYRTNWFAVKNDQFELTNPDSLTYLVNDTPIRMSLKDLDNETYEYPNNETSGKVTLIQIMGTWCPNCLDESRYLNEQKKRLGDNISIIAVTFEAQHTIEGRRAAVQSYKESLGLEYTFLMGGKASKTSASEMFPMLNSIISFPTLIFIDKAGKVRKIHTGFNGPGTGSYYEMFVEKTNMMLDQMISE